MPAPCSGCLGLFPGLSLVGAQRMKGINQAEAEAANDGIAVR